MAVGALAIVLLLAGGSSAGCQPRLGGGQSTAEAGRTAQPGAGAVDSSAAAPMEPPAAGGAPGSGVTSPGGAAGPGSHFGILTPLFPGVARDALRTACDPDDFYGGCL